MNDIQPPDELYPVENDPVDLTPPFDGESEAATLASILINPKCFAEVADIVKPGDFYIETNRWIFQAMSFLRARSEPIDYKLLADELQRMNRLEELGGAAKLTWLINQCPTSLHAGAYARKVEELAQRRAMIRAANSIAALAYSDIDMKIARERAAEVLQDFTGNDRGRYTVKTAADAMEPQQPIDWIVKNLISNASVNCFYGEPGSKKTFTALSLAVCVSNGKSWLDHVTKKCPVLFVDEESGARRFSRRLGDSLRGELCKADSPIYYVCLTGFKLDNKTDPVIIQTLIEKYGAGLVIFDALSELMDGDENFKKDVQPVFNALRKIAESTDAAILVIHHSNKQGGYRGSSVIKAASDTLVNVTSENGSRFVNFQSEKNRDGEKATWAAECTWTNDQFFLTARDVLEKVKPMREAMLYVIRYLTEHGASPLPDIMSAADTCSPKSANLAVYDLVKIGKARLTNPGARPAIYELIPEKEKTE